MSHNDESLPGTEVPSSTASAILTFIMVMASNIAILALLVHMTQGWIALFAVLTVPAAFIMTIIIVACSQLKICSVWQDFGTFLLILMSTFTLSSMIASSFIL